MRRRYLVFLAFFAVVSSVGFLSADAQIARPAATPRSAATPRPTAQVRIPSLATDCGSTVLLSDAFDRADTTGPTPGNLDTGETWQRDGATFIGIVSNRLYFNGVGPDIWLFVDTLNSDNFCISLDAPTISGSQDWGIVFRGYEPTPSSGQLDFLLAHSDGTNVKFWKNIGDPPSQVYTQLGTATYAFTQGNTMEAQVVGNALTLKVEGTTQLSITDATLNTRTMAGVYGGSNQEAHRFDNWTMRAYP